MSDRIDNLVDQAKIDSQFAHIKKQIEEIIKMITKMNNLGKQFNFGGMGGSGSGAGSGGGRNAARQAQTELDRLKAAIERLARTNSDAAKLIAQYNEQTRQQAAENRNAARLANNHSDSLNAMRARLALLIAQFDAYSAAQRKSRTEGQATLNQIRDLQREIRQLEFATGRYARNVGNYPQLVGGVKSFLGAFGVATGVYGLKQVIDEKGVISDRLGDLQRLMGITATEANRLFESLKKIDTRTGLEGLLDIAAIAARAGVAKGSIVGITEAIDKLSVVLGKDLGNADQITASLIKIVNIYSKDGKVTGQALQEIGNGLLTLSHSGVATAPFIVDFTERLAGIAKVANVSLDAALGLGAGFEELGQSAEVAGTATTQIMMRISSNVPKFAKIAGKSVEEFTKTLREKPIEALFDVARGVSRGTQYFDEFAKYFKDLETRGVRVGSTISLLGTKTDFFREKIEIAGKALGNTSNIIEQFEVKNNTFAGSWDKLKKSVENMVNDPNSSLANFFRLIIEQTTLAISWIDKMGYAFDRLAKKNNIFDISPKNLSKLATGSKYAGIQEGYVSTDDEFNIAFQAALSDRKDQQQPFIDAFGKKKITEQLKDIRELRAAVSAAKKDYQSLSAEYGKTSAAAITSAVGVAALNYRLDQYNKTFLKALNPNKGNEGDPYEREQSDKEKNAATRMREREIKADADAAKAELQIQIDTQKEIIENEQASFAERMAASEEYYRLKDELATVDANADKDRIQEEMGRNRASAKELEVVDKKLARAMESNKKELGKNITKIIKDNADDQTKTLIASYEKQKTKIEEAEVTELEANQRFYKEGKLTKEQYEVEKLRIANKYAILTLQAEIAMQEKVLEIQRQQGLPTEEQEAKLQKLKNDLQKLGLKYFEDSEKGKTDILKNQLELRKQLEEQYAEKIKDLRQEVLNFISDSVDAHFENEKNQIQREIDAIDKRADAEVKAVNQSTRSEEEKAAAINVIQNTATQQKEALERKQREIDTRSAQFQKLMALLQIGVTTGESIFKIQAQAAVLAANPVTAAFAGQALAQIPLVVAAGALQAAAIAVKPVPRYWMGTDDHPGGWAQVNDGGQLEVLEMPDGNAFVAQGMNAYVNLPRHSKVHPSVKDFQNAINVDQFKPLPVVDAMSVANKQLAREIVAGIGNVSEVSQAIASMPSDRTIITEEGMKHQWWNGKSWFDYENKYMR